MNIADTMPGLSGRIEVFHINKTNQKRDLILAKNNVITYSAADLMAHVLAGDDAYLPKHIGFLYGTNPSPLLPDPDSLPADIRRIHTWASITSDTAAINGNILIAPLALTPGVMVDGSVSLYSGNAVLFTSHTGLGIEYAYPTNGSTFAPSLPDLEGSGTPVPVYFYHVILLNRWEQKGSIIYTPFARSALGSAPFDPKPASNHMAVYWTVTFK